MASPMRATSGSYNFSPSVADLIVDALERIQIFLPSTTLQHIVSARRSMNLWLSEVSGNMGINLGQVDQINLALTPGQAQFPLPPETVELLDVYLRYFSPNGPTAVVGNALTPLGPAGNPLVSQPYGDPMLIAPASGTLSCTAGSQLITMNWPSHGLSPGNPIFWDCIVSIGGLAISNMSIVSVVPNGNTLQFYAPAPALETQTLQGGTQLFSTTLGSPLITTILPGHGYSNGSTFEVGVSVNAGGIILEPGTTYTVQKVNSLYEFIFQPGPLATATASVFENGGQLNVTTEITSASGGYEPTDLSLFPLSRNDYASIPQKFVPGRPTSFWFDRTANPNFSIYPVTPPPSGTNPTSYYGFMAYRLRKIQDANPLNGQIPDIVSRGWQALTAATCAALAEKFKPAAHEAKLALAQQAWDRFANADVEHAILHVQPALQGYFR